MQGGENIAVTRPTRVAYVITRLDVGGAQETVVALASALPRPSFDVTVLAGSEVEAGDSIAPELRRLSVEVVLLGELRSSIRPAADLRAVWALRRELLRIKPDIVHTHSSKAGVIGRVAARMSGRPAVVHTVHGWSFHSHQPAPVAVFFRTVERLLARWTDALVVVASRDRELGLEHRIGDDHRYHLIPSGILLGGGRGVEPQELPEGEPEFRVAFVGRLAAQKNPLLAIRGFALFRRQVPRSRLLLVGDGPLRREVSQAIQQLGLQDAVELLGIRRDVRRLLRQADAFLLTSDWEGMPRTVLEAAAEGVPVVTCLVGGLAELIEHDVSGIVHDGTPEGVASALQRLRGDPALATAVAKEAASRLAPFDAQVMVSRTVAMYEGMARTR